MKGASWIARGALYQRKFPAARQWASTTLAAAEKALGNKRLDHEADLEIAIGASLEVLGQCDAATGKRANAIRFFEDQCERYKGTPVEKRLRKNWNLLALAGKSAPPIGGTLPKSSLIFLWAHYCGDCKTQASVVTRVAERYKSAGLNLTAPTQLYGTINGKDAPAPDERAFVEKTWQETYCASSSTPHSIDAEVVRIYGARTTPTIVLTDREGKVRTYRAGRMTEAQLDQAVAAAFASKVGSASVAAGRLG